MPGWPVALAASCVWMGILLEGLGRRGPGSIAAAAILVGGAAAAVVAAVASVPSRRVRIGCIAIAFLLLGAGWSGLREARTRGSPLSASLGRTVRLEGSLGSDPVPGSLGWTASMEVALLDTAPRLGPGGSAIGALRVHDSLWVEGHGAPPPWRRGDRVAVTGTLQAPHGDFGRYLRHLGYVGTLSAGELRFLAPSASPIQRAATRVRDALRRSVSAVFPPKEAGLILGLTLGDTSRLDPAVAEDFQATGLSHLTAVSGENVAMFLAPILGLATWLGLRRLPRLLIGLGAVVFFVFLTGGEPSVLRAAVMAGLTMLGVFLGRPRSPPAILGAAVLLLLAINPALVYALGFQLSVAATGGMALLTEPLGRRLRILPRGVALASAATLGAQAGVTPLLLYHFGVVPTVTVAANLLAFFAVGPGMLLGLAAASLGLVARPLGLAVAWGARIPLGYLEGLADRLARFPMPSITSPGGQLAALAAGMVLVVALGLWIRSGRPVPRLMAVAACALLPVVLWSRALVAGPPGALTVTFFDVGQGDAALIRSPDGATVLIDGGPDPEEVAVKLAALGVRRLDLMVATHPHADHVAGLPAVLARFPVALAIDPGCRGDSPFYAQFLQALAQAHVPFRHPRPGALLRVGDLGLRVLGPERCFRGTDSDPNNDSLVLRVTETTGTSGGRSILFPGDVEEPGQQDLLRDEAPFLAAPLLKVPHHGGNTTLNRFFLAVHAAVAVISVGQPNLYGHPSPVVLAELARDRIRTYRTDRSGDVTVRLEGSGMAVSLSRG